MVLLLCGLILPLKEATMTIATFLIAGAIGFPVFAGGAGGLTYFAGPTGGFLAGFAFVPLSINLASSFNPSKKHGWGLCACCFAGLVPIYVGGVFWLHYGIGLTLKKAVLTGVAPFIPGAFLKVAIAVAIFTGIRERNIILKR
jgi:biotin transport system substrate-specific component